MTGKPNNQSRTAPGAKRLLPLFVVMIGRKARWPDTSKVAVLVTSIINTNLTRHRNDKFRVGRSKKMGKTVSVLADQATLCPCHRNCFQKVAIYVLINASAAQKRGQIVLRPTSERTKADLK